MQSWLEGRNWIGKCAQATGMTASLRKLSSEADLNTWESFTRSELKLESVHQESPRSDIFRKGLPSHFWTSDNVRCILKEKKNWTVAQWSKVIFSDERNVAFHLEIKVPESGGRVERHIIHVAWSPVWSFHSRDDLGCHVSPYWCWSEVHSQRSHLPGNFRAFHASFCWQALWRCWFHFPAGFGTCPHC